MTISNLYLSNNLKFFFVKSKKIYLIFLILFLENLFLETLTMSKSFFLIN